ncbi:MAG: hydrogenase maturation nickel metallochaperone HypA [Candidatus Omnitrophota bacterium]
MHEMSIASELMDQILEVARENNMVSVDSVEIETGVLKQIVPEIMQTAFEAVKKETIAEKAQLKIIEIPALVRCKICDNSFEPKIDDFLCPECRMAEIEILQGDGIILKTISGQTQDDIERKKDQ